ncbi:MAG: hypothetical protein JWN25_2736 [Verrucomicrobiales bacterium]|jgi:hypothetical protein|nr:hypothetical protein [Verrucomicrobiales bacterium]MDB6131079.1 hypothetical protein [Verrucomicrobiales bacterium]
MNPYTKGAVFILRLSALGLIVISLILLYPNLLAKLAHKKLEGTSVGLFFIIKLLTLLGGSWLLINARKIAKNWTDDLDG